MNVRLTEAQKIKILNSDDLYSVMQQVLLRENKIDRNKEHFWIVCLSTSNQILMIELVSLGSVNATIVDPMEVFSFALQKRAVKLILVHNHPSGELTPSASDKEMTDRMLAIGKFIQLPVIDHLIISETYYYSFVDSGLLEEIERTSTYDLSFSQISSLKEELNTIENRKAEAIAKSMLSDGHAIEVVAKHTGLTVGQVEKLK
ncbi:MAG: repair protein [Cytophagaceae bacterium]|jgi:DNA repair protein RadC|nr:repair protein [Cytophagaceae bacterium]